MLSDMWMTEVLADLFGTARAVRNAASVLDAHRAALAEVDSVVDRIQRHDAVRTAA
jgi:hypothetical protein